MVSIEKEQTLPHARQKKVRKWEKSVAVLYVVKRDTEVKAAKLQRRWLNLVGLLRLLLPAGCMGSGAPPEPAAEPPWCTAGHPKGLYSGRQRSEGATLSDAPNCDIIITGQSAHPAFPKAEPGICGTKRT